MTAPEKPALADEIRALGRQIQNRGAFGVQDDGSFDPYVTDEITAGTLQYFGEAAGALADRVEALVGEVAHEREGHALTTEMLIGADEGYAANRVRIEALEKRVKIAEKKVAAFDRLPFCPDHCDKVNGKPCRECRIEALVTAVREWVDANAEWASGATSNEVAQERIYQAERGLNRAALDTAQGE